MKLLQKIAAAAEKMSPRKILLLCTLLAVIVFIVIYSALSSLLGGREEKKEEQAVNDLVPVIEASKDIPARMVITEDMLKATAVPKELVPQGAITDKSKIVGKPAAVAIFSGDMITLRKLNDTRMNGFTGLIPQGMRAISFAVNDVTGVSGFAKPGDKIDILLISDKDGKNRIASRTILKDVLLLAVNKNSMAMRPYTAPKKEGENKDDKSLVEKSAPPVNDGTSAGTPAVVTVALSPYEAAKLTASAQVGQLQIMLRPFDANAAASDSVAYYVIPMPKPETAKGVAAPAAPSYAPAPQPSPSSQGAPSVSISSGNGSGNGMSGIEVIRGTNVSKGY